MIGNKVAVGGAEEEFNLEDLEFGESGTNPNPEPSDSPEEDGATASSVTLSSTTKKKRACGTPTEEGLDEFTEMHCLILLSMQENAEADEQQGREEQQANCMLMQIIGTSLASMAAAWASGNKTASAVSRPGQQQPPAVRGLCKEHKEVLLEEESTPPKQPCQSNCKQGQLQLQSFKSQAGPKLTGPLSVTHDQNII